MDILSDIRFVFCEQLLFKLHIFTRETIQMDNSNGGISLPTFLVLPTAITII